MFFDPDIMATLPRPLYFLDPVIEKSKVYLNIIFNLI